MSSNELIKEDGKGKFRIANGRAKYSTREAAERALHGYQAATGISIRGQRRSKLTDMVSKEVRGNNL